LRKVYCIGETVLDVIFREGKVVSAQPGGSMLNTAISLARAGMEVEFISDFGLDRPGDLVGEFLKQNGVSTRFVSRYADGKTTLALAFLDEQREAAYSFYRDLPSSRLDIDLPVTAPDDLVLFGSFYALTPAIREKLVSFVRAAKQQGSLVIYDPNFRKPHLHELPALKPRILENIAMADLVRGSDEDFLHIFAAATAQAAWSHFPPDVILVCTTGGRMVEVLGAGKHLRFPVPEIEVVSTVGAGDAFNAGLISAIVQRGMTRETLPLAGEQEWHEMTGTGIRFAQDVCLQYDNYISDEMIKSLG
jgi:fructokinase